MRKLLIGLFLAGAAAPALAAGGPHDHHRDDNSSSKQQSHAQAPARGGNQARPQFEGRPQGGGERPQFNGQRPQFAGQRPQFNGERPQFGGERPQFNGQRPQSNGERPQFNGGMRDEQAQAGGYYRQRQGGPNGQARYAGRGYAAGEAPRQGYQQQSRRFEGSRGGAQWNRNWRNDRRYDWRDRRNRNRSLFHLGVYIDPFGWDYQSYGIGYQLEPRYYEQNYWIDPGLYGLPYPPPGMQWVRYYNDALLIDMYSGEIVDEIPGFFW